MIHGKALVEPGATIGDGTRVWAFAHILGGARIGRDCNICDHVFVENDVILGDRVTVKSGVQLWDGLHLEDDVFVGPNATFTNDKFPRSKHYPSSFPRTVVRKGASIGANATILPGLTIGTLAMVGAGAVVTRDVPPRAIVVGNPARITGYVDTPAQAARESERAASRGGSQTAVNGVGLYELRHVTDLRGDLCVAELKDDIPFEVKRVFFVYDVPSSRVRGEHVHKVLHEFVLCLRGSVSIVVDDGTHHAEYCLDRPWLGLHLPPRVWRSLYKFSADALLAVFASHEYDPGDYVRSYDDFLKLVGQ
jgi:acetyltransferase-like isoleucine patch superfamily enzyme/dTDP-4-dehydrorhamnose 3,5-epimerase-like enzyme